MRSSVGIICRMADLIPADVLTQYLHDHIPLTGHMGIVVAECSPERVVLVAPLAPNVNHRETAFGGSLSGAAILAGWAWLHARLAPRGRKHRLVVSDSSISFERPVEGTFQAICETTPDETLDRFLMTFDRRGKSRITLASRVECDGAVAARHTGRYVALAGR